jgi:hypothetical protein
VQTAHAGRTAGSSPIYKYEAGMLRLYVKGKRSHRTDATESYQLPSFKDDVDLEARLGEWECLYAFVRPHCAHRGKPPLDGWTPRWDVFCETLEGR